MERDVETIDLKGSKPKASIICCAPDVVRETAPDVILASSCGKKVVPNRRRGAIRG